MDRRLDASDFIKPYVAVAEVEPNVEKGISPFDYIKSITNTKKDLMEDNSDNEKLYKPFLINRGLGYFVDTVLFANEMNLYPDIPVKSQYYYYLAAIRKGNRYAKWEKHKKDEDQELVQMVYNARPEVAKQYLKLLSKEDIKKLYALTDTGENKKPAKP